MTTTTLPENKNTKIKFFSVYAVSVLLVVAIFAALWKNEPQIIKSYEPAPVAAAKGKITQVNNFLDDKLRHLNNLYNAAANADAGSRQNLTKNILSAETGLQASLDSLLNDAQTTSNEEEKLELTTLITKFKSLNQSRMAFTKSYFDAGENDSKPVGDDSELKNTIASNNSVIQELKGILLNKEEEIDALKKQQQAERAEKNKVINSLENQLAKKPNVPVQTVTSNKDGEWKQKHAKLKSAYDNLEKENTTLKRSFRTLVDDNRRLLAQIQASKKQ